MLLSIEPLSLFASYGLWSLFTTDVMKTYSEYSLRLASNQFTMYQTLNGPLPFRSNDILIAGDRFVLAGYLYFEPDRNQFVLQSSSGTVIVERPAYHRQVCCNMYSKS